MGKASSSKKVARAASTGGGRTSRGSRPWSWYMAMTAVVLIGSVILVTSRNERQAASNPLKSEKPRPADKSRNFAGDHWHAAYGIYICDQFIPNIQSDKDPSGIHTHNDGIVHIHPFTRAVSGRKATFGVFADTVGLKVSKTSIQAPGGKKYSDGDKCGEKKGELQVWLNGKEREDADPRKLRVRDRDLLVLAFAPSGAEYPREPPSKSELDNLSDVVENPAATTVPGTPADGTATTVPGATTDSTAPATTAPAATATTAPTTTATTSP